MQESPEMIQIGAPRSPVETVAQQVYSVPRQQKLDLLLHLLGCSSMYSVLVFSRTKHGADRIKRHLERAGVPSVSIHSGRSQAQRRQALEGFRSGKFQVMVATDIAARGLDVQGISHVVNFDVPAFAEDYIHRIGRTGRAAATGDAITFVAPEEREYVGKIEKFIGRKFRPQECPGFTCTISGSRKPKCAEQRTTQRRKNVEASGARKPHASQRRRRRGLKRRAV